jgi:hypothetical protein
MVDRTFEYCSCSRWWDFLHRINENPIWFWAFALSPATIDSTFANRRASLLPVQARSTSLMGKPTTSPHAHAPWTWLYWCKTEAYCSYTNREKLNVTVLMSTSRTPAVIVWLSTAHNWSVTVMLSTAQHRGITVRLSTAQNSSITVQMPSARCPSANATRYNNVYVISRCNAIVLIITRRFYLHCCLVLGHLYCLLGTATAVLLS